MSHERWEELVIAQAVDGTLSAEEARELIPHLAGCSDCRALVEDLSAAAAELAFLEDPVAPPPLLERRILRSIRSQEPAGRAMRAGRARRAVTAVAVAASLALATTSVTLYRSLDERRDEQTQLATALDLIADPSSRIARLDAANGPANGILAVGADGTGWLVVDGLAPAPQGRIHELWVIQASKPQPVGVFTIAGERTVVPVTLPDGGFEAAAITEERAPHGSPVPTGNMLLSGPVA